MFYTKAIVLSILGYTAAGAPLGGFGGLNGLDSGKSQKMSEYLDFLSTNLKSYNDNTTFQERLGLYIENDNKINECNWNADHTDEKDPVHCAHNQFSDWTDAEYEAILGFVGNDDQLEETEGNDYEDYGGLLGMTQATTVDHTPYMTAVKDQSNCGSCWAFAATSTLEGTIGVRDGVAPPRLSEQQNVDCTTGFPYYQNGCIGGWTPTAWEYMRDRGVMTNEDYPYRARDQSCAYDRTKVYGHVKQYGGTPRNNVQAMKNKVWRQPVAVAIHADAPAFRFYKSGVLNSCCNPANQNCDENMLKINHAVTVVGYSEKQNYIPKRCQIRPGLWVCSEEEEVGAADADGDSGYWKVQNSYGTGWGDNGFIKIAMEGPTSQGVCRINYYGAQWVDWD